MSTGARLSSSVLLGLALACHSACASQAGTGGAGPGADADAGVLPDTPTPPTPDVWTRSDTAGSDPNSDPSDDDGRDDTRVTSDAHDDPAAEMRTDADPGDADLDADLDADPGDADGDAPDAGDTKADASPGPCEGFDHTSLGEIAPPIRWDPYTAPRCTHPYFAAVVPGGATWRFDFERLPAGSRVSIRNARFLDNPDLAAEPPLVESAPVGADGRRTIRHRPRWGAEAVIHVELPESRDTETNFRLQVACEAECGREATRHPVVLVHGYFGTDSYFNLLDYFFDIRDPMRNRGYALFTPQTHAINSSERRAQQLAEQLETILRDTGARRVNLIAHSQGGLDARVLSHAGWRDRIASITTVATPHLGIPLDVIRLVSIQDFTDDFMRDTFNPTYPDLPGIRYWSWSARSCGIIDRDCRRGNRDESIDPILVATFNILGISGPNDGVVPTAAMLWGEHLGELSADHFDQVGQIADGRSDDDPFDHRQFYLDEARRLFRAGF